MKPGVATLLLGIGVAGCTPEVRPVVASPKPPPPVVIQRTIVIQSTEPAALGVKPGSKAGRALKAFRAEERAANVARSYPGATADQLRTINETEKAAHAATQNLIDKDGHSVPADEKAAHDSIDDLHRARQAPREGTQQ
jgi:hypothetical protein